MKWDQFRRSTEVEDFTEPAKPVPAPAQAPVTISDVIKLTNSDLAKDAGINDVGVDPGPIADVPPPVE